ncbi:MAG TPA: nuclear transport factor 2 family protein, partial [Terriglobales bacterium]|nr:nuclear transport factor 2 family protein [Terriglobales bacterium]
ASIIPVGNTKVNRRNGFVAAAALLAGGLLFLAALPAGSQKRGEGDQSKILALENVWNLAIVHKDVRALDQLLAANFAGTDFDSTFMNKAEFIRSVGEESYHPQQMVNEKVEVHLHSNSAVVTGIYREKGVNKGKAYDFRARFTDTWVNEDGEWRCAASHASLLSAKKPY